MAAQPAGGRRTYGGISAEAREAERRRRLIESARELYGTTGFAGVPIQTLCKHAGVTARHFYELFDDRETVLEVVHDQIVERVGGAVIEAVAANGSDDPYQVAAVGLEAFYRAMLDDPRDARIAILEVMQLPPEKAIGCVDGFTAIIEGYASLLQPDPASEQLWTARTQSSVIVGAMRQLLIDWLTKPAKPSADQLVDITLHLFGMVWEFEVEA